MLPYHQFFSPCFLWVRKGLVKQGQRTPTDSHSAKENGSNLGCPLNNIAQYREIQQAILLQRGISCGCFLLVFITPVTDWLDVTSYTKNIDIAKVDSCVCCLQRIWERFLEYEWQNPFFFYNNMNCNWLNLPTQNRLPFQCNPLPLWKWFCQPISFLLLLWATLALGWWLSAISPGYHYQSLK